MRRMTALLSGIGVLAGGVLAAPAAPAAFAVPAPAAFAPAAPVSPASSGEPVVRVSPAAGLEAGDRVRVAARGLPADTDVTLYLCAELPTDDRRCATSIGQATTDARGRLSTRARVADPVYFQPDRAAASQPVYCRADACQVFVAWQDEFGALLAAGSQPLEFDGSPATLTVTPSDGVVPGQRVRLSGTADGSDARRVEIWQQSCWSRLGEVFCTGERVAVVPLRRDDTFAARVRVRRYLGADSVDCVDAETGRCQYTARLIDPRTGAPDPSFGDPAFGHPAAEIFFAAP